MGYSETTVHGCIQVCEGIMLEGRSGFCDHFLCIHSGQAKGIYIKSEHKIFKLDNWKVIETLRVIRYETVFQRKSAYYNPFQIILVLRYTSSDILQGRYTRKTTGSFVCDLYIYIQRCTETYTHVSGEVICNE